MLSNSYGAQREYIIYFDSFKTNFERERVILNNITELYIVEEGTHTFKWH